MQILQKKKRSDCCAFLVVNYLYVLSIFIVSRHIDLPFRSSNPAFRQMVTFALEVRIGFASLGYVLIPVCSLFSRTIKLSPAPTFENLFLFVMTLFWNPDLVLSCY